MCSLCKTDRRKARWRSPHVPALSRSPPATAARPDRRQPSHADRVSTGLPAAAARKQVCAAPQRWRRARARRQWAPATRPAQSDIGGVLRPLSPPSGGEARPRRCGLYSTVVMYLLL